jgi:hypothetical protein
LRVYKVKRFCGGGWFAHDYRSLDIWRELVHGFLPQTSNPDRLGWHDVRKRKEHNDHVTIAWLKEAFKIDGDCGTPRRLHFFSLAREVLVVEDDADEYE